MKIFLRNSILLPQQVAQIESDLMRLVAETKIFTKVLRYTGSAGSCRLDMLYKLVA